MNIENENSETKSLKVNKKKVLTYDLSGTGETGFCLVDESQDKINFGGFKNKDWKLHLKQIIEQVNKENPNIIVYEHTNYINLMGKDMTSLFKLFGSIECLKFFINDLEEISIVPVNQVKSLYGKIYNKEKFFKNVSYKVGRGGGWLFTHDDDSVERISKHCLDAYLVYRIYKENQEKNFRKKVGIE